MLMIFCHFAIGAKWSQIYMGVVGDPKGGAPVDNPNLAPLNQRSVRQKSAHPIKDP